MQPPGPFPTMAAPFAAPATESAMVPLGALPSPFPQTLPAAAAPWTESEELQLHALVERHGENSWALIAETMGGVRSATAAEAQWRLLCSRRQAAIKAAAAQAAIGRSTPAAAGGATYRPPAHVPQSALLAGGSGCGVMAHAPAVVPPPLFNPVTQVGCEGAGGGG